MADERCWRVEEDGAGARLDAYITERTELTRSRVAALIEEGQALVNGRAAGKAGLRLRAGDEVRLCVPEAREAGVEAQNIDLRVVYEDSDLAVVFKPSGMVVHPAAPATGRHAGQRPALPPGRPFRHRRREAARAGTPH